MQEVADRVFRFGSSRVNWYVVLTESGVTLVDAGFPSHWRQLESGLPQLGKTLKDVEAILITHAHIDHTGFAERARTALGVPVRINAGDVEGGQARKYPPLQEYWRPTSWTLLGEGILDGMAFTSPVKNTEPLEDGAIVDPGGFSVISLPGHTPGSCALHLPDRDCIFTGDALVTLDPYTGQREPRLVLGDVAHNEPLACQSLSKLEGLTISTVLPGHGEPWTTGVASAAALAQAAGG